MVAPDTLTTSAQRLISSRTSLANSSGVFGAGCAPSAASRSAVSGALSTAVISVSSFDMIGAGVPGGAKRPYHDVTSYPGTPDSATVGTLGSSGERALLVTASGRSRPDWT